MVACDGGSNHCARNTQAALLGGMPAAADVDADADAAWEAEQRELAALSCPQLTALQGRLEEAGWDELYDKSSEAVRCATELCTAQAVQSLYKFSLEKCYINSVWTSFTQFTLDPCGRQVYYHERATGATRWMCPVAIPAPSAEGGRPIQTPLSIVHW